MILTFPSQKQQKPEPDVLSIAQNRSEMGLRLAKRLESISRIKNSPKTALNAKKLRLCADPKNIYIANDLHSRETGECFDGGSNLWACELAYCPNCNADLARARRRVIRDALTRLKPRVGHRWQFVTLTATDIDFPLLESMQVYLRAWELLRKREFWRKSVWAGWRSVEFTIGAGSGLNHVHLHALTLAKFLRADDVRAEWTDAIKKAWWEKGISLTLKTANGLANVHIDEIKSKRGSAMEAAILEIAKYVCKSDAWLNLTPSDLFAVAECKKLPRLFDSFGKARGKTERLDSALHLDTQVLNDGKIRKLKSPKIPDNIEILTQKAADARLWRKAQLLKMFPAADFQTLDGRDF